MCKQKILEKLTEIFLKKKFPFYQICITFIHDSSTVMHKNCLLKLGDPHDNSLAKKQSNSLAFRVAWEECLLIIEFMEQQKHHQYKTKEQKKKKKKSNTRKALEIHGDTRTMNKKESIESSKENSESFSVSDGDLPLPINSRSKYISLYYIDRHRPKSTETIARQWIHW